MSLISPTRAAAANAALAQLFADERAFSWKEDPLSATSDGVHDYDDRLASSTPADWQRRTDADKNFLSRLHAIDRATLNPQEQVSYDLFDFMVSERVTLAAYDEWRVPINSDSGFYVDILTLDETANPRTVRDYENYIARLNDA
jgi:uncharacterized protein (DUF885 family)